MVDEDQKEGSLGEKAYWKDLWECYIEEKSIDYASLSVKEAIPRLVSEQNLRERRHAGSCGELGVDIRVGDICYIDFGEAYIAVDLLSTSNGVKKRYGFIYVDRTDDDPKECARIRKDSFYWYKQVIKSNGADL